MPSKGVDIGQSKNISGIKSVEELPLTFDWSTEHVIGPIRDQERVSHFSLCVQCILGGVSYTVSIDLS